MSKGTLIVIEGLDGSGKATQAKLLFESLQQKGKNVRQVSFPDYDSDSSALVKMYLAGDFGSDPGDVNAYAASTFFAVDRYASFKKNWREFYENGGVVIADRYTTSNAVHQGSKLPDRELADFFTWLADLEYHKMGLPEPDLVLYLDVDLETSRRRMRSREEQNHTSADIHELDSDYLARCLRTADKACEHYGWRRVPFLKNGTERDVDEKNDELYRIILETLGNK